MNRELAEQLADDLWDDLARLEPSSSPINPHKKLLADFIEGLADAVEYNMMDEWLYRRSMNPDDQNPVK